jgi:soluble lytic murein transglycosylase-like protein
MTPAPFILAIPVLIAALLFSPNPTQASFAKARKLKAAPRGTKEYCPSYIAELAEKWGSVFGVPRDWICSQAFVESSNDPSKVNHRSGAMGLLQVMPLTAAWHIENLRKVGNNLVKTTIKRLWKGRPADLLNPDLNIMVAAAHMKFLKKIFGDNHDLVAAAYDAGHNRILKLIREGKPLPQQSRMYIAMVHEAKQRGYV